MISIDEKKNSDKGKADVHKKDSETKKKRLSNQCTEGKTPKKEDAGKYCFSYCDSINA